MDFESRLSLSFYKEISTISEAHKIYVVQHISSGKIYIKKVLDVYNKAVYEYLKKNPIPHTPIIYELYEENQKLVIIEEYLPGETLEQLLDRQPQYDFKQIKSIMYKLCLIVKALHDCIPPIIHRDIKPSNIIITRDGEIYLLDFNAAKYLSLGKEEDTTLLGTKGYAAPEQYGFGTSSEQTDIYALGIVLKNLCDNSTPDCRSKFDPVIEKCTKLNPDERYSDVEELLKLMASPRKTFAKDLPAWTRFLPPGFRTLSPINMFVSVFGYGVIFSLCLTLNMEGSSAANMYADRIITLLMFLSIIFCSANYLNIQSTFRPCRTKNVYLHFLAVILMDVLVVIGFLLLIPLSAAIFS